MPVTTPKSRPVKAVIFDMDGLLIDSERLYTQCTNELLAPIGKSMTWDIKASVMGRPGIEASQILIDRTGLPMTPQEVMDTMAKRQVEVFPTVEPMRGAERLVRHLEKCGVPIAIATGSNRPNFILKSTHLPNLFKPFKNHIVCGDDASLKRGKPNPDVFLLAASRYLGLPVTADPETGVFASQVPGGTEEEGLGEGLKVEDCLVFEDGVPGVQAAIAAGMRVVWAPEDDLMEALGGKEKAIAEVGATETLCQPLGLDGFKPEEWGLPPFDD